MRHLFNFNSIKGSLNVITGCGSGLGKATLEWFIKHGSGPILGIDYEFEADYLDQLRLDDSQKANLMLRSHATFDIVKAESSLSEFTCKHGRIDNLINVAGVSLAFFMYWQNKNSVYDMRHVENLFKFNTLGSFNMIRLASKYMIDEKLQSVDKSRPKCIINTSCISTTSPSLGQTFYAGSKAALDSMTLSIARELGQYNIRCNTINVGYFDTKLVDSSEERVKKYLELNSVLPKRLGHPEEFAHLVQAIVENQMINGACIKIDAASKEAH